MRYLHVALALAVVSIAMAQEPEEIVLPRPMGAINDYAAVLGGARQSLEEELQTIKENFHVQIVILATIYDPYDDPPRYAQEIWGFGSSAKTRCSWSSSRSRRRISGHLRCAWGMKCGSASLQQI
jgi:uncharacterized membrane protein YgcG